MLGAYGLRTHIWNNRLKSLLLLAGFPVLLLLICFGFALVIAAFSNPDVGEGIEMAIEMVPALIPVPRPSRRRPSRWPRRRSGRARAGRRSS